MLWAFDLFQQFRHIVQAEPGSKFTEIARRYLERLNRLGFIMSDQSAANRLVDHLTKRSARSARLGTQLGSNVVVERQGRTHIMMLYS